MGRDRGRCGLSYLGVHMKTRVRECALLIGEAVAALLAWALFIAIAIYAPEFVP